MHGKGLHSYRTVEAAGIAEGDSLLLISRFNRNDIIVPIMGKVKVRPEGLGKVFFKFFKDEMEQGFSEIIEGIIKINNENIKIDVSKLYDDLIFLHVFAYHQEISRHFESYIQVFSKGFHDEFENFLKRSMPKEDVIDFFITLNIVLLEYFKKYDEIIRNEKNRNAALTKFGSYIAGRILGKKYEGAIPFSWYFSVVYGDVRMSLKKIIQSSLEIDD
jgi:hypothetical protein